MLIAKKFNPTGNTEMARFNLDGKSLVEVEREIIGEIKSKLD